MGTFADALAAQPEKNRGEVCTVERVRRAMSDTDRQQLDDALADFGISHARLSRALSAMGHRIDQSTIGRHRKNDCKCGNA